MNEYKFKDLNIGLSEEFDCIITQDKLTKFRDISGDTNPLHNDEKYAKEHGFSGRVAYGLLTASLISTLGGVYLPGKYCLIQQIKSKFLLPVYIDDVLTVKGIVKELNESIQRAVIGIEIRNQHKEKVLKATLDVGFLE
ncbi:MAG: MaoC/PaaZ C-terminal domain-containing protein [Synergistaceae bacterium]|nr:MaoC/PaaZ C-terminal domain-containing protein [Synergistaceae bacterium]